jgi:hypothetical protein
MPKAIHLKCDKDDRGQPKNTSCDVATKTFSSGNWDLSVADAEALVGGWLYLHTAKSEKSYFGGPITGFEQIQVPGVARNNRIVLKFHPAVAGKNAPWRSKDSSKAWTGGLVEAERPHELKAFVPRT